jgi:uncharacterized protein (TIGR00369 family)
MTEQYTAYIEELRRTGDFARVIGVIPYARYLGLTVDLADGDPITRLPADPKLTGNPVIGAIHGGVVGALLESAAILKLLWEGAGGTVPKTINITIDYLRSTKVSDATYARAIITKHGRRVANVQVRAWQQEEAKPIAAAHAHFLLNSSVV